MTKSKMSKGVNVTDHQSENNNVIVLECEVTTTPLVTYENNLITSDDRESRTHTAYSVIKNLWKRGELCTIVHKFDTHYNMVLLEPTPVIHPSNKIGFRLKFEEARFVGEKRITLVQNMDALKKKDSNGENNTGDGEGKKELTEKDDRGIWERTRVDLGKEMYEKFNGKVDEVTP